MEELEEFDDLILKICQECWFTIQNNLRGKDFSTQEAVYMMTLVLAKLACAIHNDTFESRIDKSKTKEELKNLLAESIMQLTLEEDVELEEYEQH